MAFRTKIDSSGAGDTSFEQLDSSIEMQSPSSPVCAIQPRKLRFASPSRDDEPESRIGGSPLRSYGGAMADNHDKTPTTMSISPPYRKVRALRLFDTPATPKTILEKSSGKCLNHLSVVAATDVAQKQESLFLKTIERPRSLPLHNRALDNVMQQQTANVNPFTPDSK